MRSADVLEGRLSRLVAWIVGLGSLDLVSKVLAVAVAGDDDLGPITPRVNKEFALGLTSSATSPVVLAVMAVMATAVFVHGWRLFRRGHLAVAGFACLVAGAGANAIDRIATGGVHDWLHIGPIVLNVADVLLVVGLLWYVWASQSASARAAAGSLALKANAERFQP